jgi:ribosomal-protein-alanine N-acetyltransferase
MAAVHRAAFTQSRPWSEAEFHDLMSSDRVFACGDARAFALVRVVADEAELLTIATHPEHQRVGHAKRLMAAWQAEAAIRGAARAFLEVAADNDPARGLYAACGYRPAGLRRAYYQRGAEPAADAVIMTRDLTLG